MSNKIKDNIMSRDIAISNIKKSIFDSAKSHLFVDFAREMIGINIPKEKESDILLSLRIFFGDEIEETFLNKLHAMMEKKIDLLTSYDLSNGTDEEENKKILDKVKDMYSKLLMVSVLDVADRLEKNKLKESKISVDSMS